MHCILCRAPTKAFYSINSREYVECHNCGGIQLSPDFYIKSHAEKARYLTHNNDVKDPRYQKFVLPITSRILQDFSAENKGLDYGCGTGPVAATELEKRGFEVALYDPFFHPDTKVLNKTYDFIICCEVMEHFFLPAQEFSNLAERLNPGGKLYCKTSLYSPAINFKKWYYKDDPTHVFFYTEKSLQWIKDHSKFSRLEIYSDLIVFTK